MYIITGTNTFTEKQNYVEEGGKWTSVLRDARIFFSKPSKETLIWLEDRQRKPIYIEDIQVMKVCLRYEDGSTFDLE